MDVHFYDLSVRIGCQGGPSDTLCCQGNTAASAGGQASWKEMRSVAVRAEQQIAAGQAEVAAAQEHNQLLQEMLHDAQVRLPGLQTRLVCRLPNPHPAIAFSIPS